MEYVDGHPDLELTKKNIEEIRNIDLENTPYEEVYDIVERCTAGSMGFLFPALPIEYVFRGRLGVFDNCNRLWYPPKELVASYGRFNKPNESVFYGSLDPDTSIFELVRLHGVEAEEEIDELVTIIKIGAKAKTQKYLPLGFPVPYMSRIRCEESVFNALTIRVIEAIAKRVEAEMLGIIPRDEIGRSIATISRFLNHLVTSVADDANRYKITNALAHELWEKIGEDGILYPSVEEEGSFNVAIPIPTFEANFASPIESEMTLYRITGKGRNTIFYPIRSSKETKENGDVAWEDLPLSGENDPKKLKDLLDGMRGMQSP